MDDAISRSDLEKRIRVYADQVHFRGEFELANGILKSLMIITDSPALDVQPVVHASWSDDGICSACGNEASYTEWTEKQFDYDWDENLVECGEEVHRSHDLTEYCPNCGARMDGDPHESGQ